MDKEIRENYGISEEHLKICKRFADDYETPIDEHMVQMVQIAYRREFLYRSWRSIY
jgi:uncharacterized protein YeeX (DUF496 family)